MINTVIGAKETNKREADTIDEIVVTNKAIEFHEIVLVDKANVAKEANNFVEAD